MKHIAIITGAALCRNPRVVKEATALREAGYKVTVLGPALSDVLSLQDAELTQQGGWRHIITVDLATRGVENFRARLVRRMTTKAVRYLKMQIPQALGYGVHNTLQMARLVNADLYIGHQEIGLWVVDRLAHENHRVGVDIEDWYSEDLLPYAQRERPLHLLRCLENRALNVASHLTTTSEAMSNAMVKAIGGQKPVVVYNAFPWKDRTKVDGMYKDRPNRHNPSLHWVSQTIGPGRGLEVLFTALNQIAVPIVVHLRGVCSKDDESRLRNLFPNDRGHRLYFHNPVPPEELLSRISEHDIGLALEPKEPLNRDLTITNKILHYLLAGLAVVATDTAGQREVAALAPEAVHLCGAEDVDSLACTINQLLTSSDRLIAARAAALTVAHNHLCWEQQVPHLIGSIERALQKEKDGKGTRRS